MLLLKYAASPQEGSAATAMLAHAAGCSGDFHLLSFSSFSTVEKQVLELLGAAQCAGQQIIRKVPVEEVQTRERNHLLCQACILARREVKVVLLSLFFNVLIF